MDKGKKDKLTIWQDELKRLEELKLPNAQKRVGQSAATGDWHENADYEDAVAEVQLLQVRIKEIKELLLKFS